MSTMTRTKFEVVGGEYFDHRDSETHYLKSNMVYVILKNNQGNGYHLQEIREVRTHDNLYPIKEYSLIDPIVQSVNYSDKNVGILLNGLKGSGKTQMAMRICQKLNMPVILFEASDLELVNDQVKYLNTINDNFVVFIDEFDKKFEFDRYNESGIQSILSFMDGTNTNGFINVFILLTNSTTSFSNSSLSGRLGRIKFKVEFKGLVKEEIEKYLTDLLEDKSHVKDITDFLSDKKDITIDIISHIVDDINKLGYDVFNNLKDHYYINNICQIYSVIVMKIDYNDDKEVMIKTVKDKVNELGDKAVVRTLQIDGDITIGKVITDVYGDQSVVIYKKNDVFIIQNEDGTFGYIIKSVFDY